MSIISLKLVPHKNNSLLPFLSKLLEQETLLLLKNINKKVLLRRDI